MFSHIKPYRDEYISSLDHLDDCRVRIERQWDIKDSVEVRNTPRSNRIDNVFEPLIYGSGALFIILSFLCAMSVLDSKWAIVGIVCAVLAIVFGIGDIIAMANSGSYRHETKRINRIAKDYNRFPDEPVIRNALLGALEDLEAKLKADLAQGILTREEVCMAQRNKERSRVVNKYL